MTTRNGGPSQRRLARVVVYGKVRAWVLVALLGGVAIIAAFTAGRRAGPGEAATGAQADAQAAAPATVAAGVATFKAPGSDTLRAAIFDSSTVVLAPGATLAVGSEGVNSMGARAWVATLSGTAHFSIGTARSVFTIRAPAGEVRVGHGTYDVTASATALTTRTIAGDTALLYKPHGLFAWIPRKVPPDDVGVADQAHWAMRVTRQR